MESTVGDPHYIVMEKYAVLTVGQQTVDSSGRSGGAVYSKDNPRWKVTVRQRASSRIHCILMYFVPVYGGTVDSRPPALRLAYCFFLEQ